MCGLFGQTGQNLELFLKKFVFVRKLALRSLSQPEVREKICCDNKLSLCYLIWAAVSEHLVLALALSQDAISVSSIEWIDVLYSI